MGTFQDCTVCPRCSFNEAIYEFHTRGYFEGVFCPECGYVENWKVKIDRKRQKEDPEHREFILCNKEGKYIYHHHKPEAYGVYFYRVKDGIGVAGTICTEEAVDNFVEAMTKAFNEGQLDSVKINHWNGQEAITVLDLGNEDDSIF